MVTHWTSHQCMTETRMWTKNIYKYTSGQFPLSKWLYMHVFEREESPTQIHIRKTQHWRAWYQTYNPLALERHCCPLHHRDIPFSQKELCCGGEQSTNTISHICSIIFFPHFLCFAAVAAQLSLTESCGVLHLSQTCPSLELLFTVTHTWVLGIFCPPPPTTWITPGSAVLRLPSYRCFPISPLCCVVLPAFLCRFLITCSENLTG